MTGVELSAVAFESFCMENGIPARRRRSVVFELYEAENLELYCGDFFALTPELLGDCAAVYDRAALIAWAPEQRGAYVRHMTALTSPGTQTLLITLEYAQAQMSGPPFSLGADEVERLYGAITRIRDSPGRTCWRTSHGCARAASGNCSRSAIRLTRL